MEAYLSKMGNIWFVDWEDQCVCCNNNLVSTHFEVANPPTCNVGDVLLVEDHWTNATTETGEIVAINKFALWQQIKDLITELNAIKEQYGPVVLSTIDGIVHIGIGQIPEQCNQMEMFIIGTIDFGTMTIERMSDAELESKSNHWNVIKDSIDISNEFEDIDSEESLDYENDDIKDEMTLQAFATMYNVFEIGTEEAPDVSDNFGDNGIEED